MRHFLCVLLDDDPLNNMLNRLVIERNYPQLEIVEFTDADSCLNFIAKNTTGKRVLLFVDIYMPQKNGWDFLNVLRTFSTEILNRISVFMLSSSIYLQDNQRADNDPIVTGFLTKPLTDDSLKYYVVDKLR